MRRRGPLLWGVAAAVVLALLIIFGLRSSGSTKAARRAPSLPTEHLGGAPVTLASLLASAHGRPAVVVFWASWCGPCAQEASSLEHFSQGSSGRGRIVGVNWSDALSGARSFIRRYAWTFPNVRDGEGTVGNAYRITGLPTSYVIDGSGRIRTALRGPQTASTLERALAAAERT